MLHRVGWNTLSMGFILIVVSRLSGQEMFAMTVATRVFFGMVIAIGGYLCWRRCWRPGVAFLILGLLGEFWVFR